MRSPYLVVHHRNTTTLVPKTRTRDVPCPTCGTDRAMLNGAFFRGLRIASGITLREMARRLGVSSAYVSDIERNLRTFLPKYALAYDRLKVAHAGRSK